MKNILIISATSKTNLSLANKIKLILDKEKKDTHILNLDKIKLPLYTESNYNNVSKTVENQIKNITLNFIESNALVICAPEYNGSIPPIITNVIAWISVSTKYWKDGFNNKNALITTSSGGEGMKFCKSMKIQLEHLGMIVFKEFISTNNNNPFDKKKSSKILKQFIKNI